MKIGYARVSTYEQNLAMQIEALNQVDCEKIIEDKITGSVKERPRLKDLEKILRKGDTLIAWRLDRLGRTLRHLIEYINELEAKEVYFKSINENIDTTTANGKLIFHMFGALAEFERNLISERTRSGLEIVRLGERPIKLREKDISILKDIYASKKYTLKEISQYFNISIATVYRYI